MKNNVFTTKLIDVIASTNIDKLSYAGNLESLKDIENHKNYNFIKADIANAKIIEEIILEEAPGTIMHLAAESHVDRSIENPMEFINSNILGTVNLVQSFMKLMDVIKFKK